MSSGSKQLIAIVLLMLIFIAAYWYEQRHAQLTRLGPSNAKEVIPAEKEVAKSRARTSPTTRPAQPPSTDEPSASVTVEVSPVIPSAEIPVQPAGPPDPPGVIRHPANGSFHVMVVQSSTWDQLPEIRDSLTGRPIYTVYVPIGTAKDWALYFSIPGDKGTPDPNGSVVRLGPATRVQPPYPTTLVRPEVSKSSGIKTVLIYGRVNAAGRFEDLRVIKAANAKVGQALVASLQRWEFRPATEDGDKVGVEVVLSVPAAGL